jgi:hypothetical protein
MVVSGLLYFDVDQETGRQFKKQIESLLRTTTKSLAALRRI